MVSPILKMSHVRFKGLYDKYRLVVVGEGVYHKLSIDSSGSQLVVKMNKIQL